MQLPNEERLLKNKHKKECRDQLLEGYISYVKKLTQYYDKAHRDDLFGEGMLGLLHAINTYDKDKCDGSFINYARYWILYFMNSFLVKTGVISLPKYIFTLLQRYDKYISEFLNSENRLPTNIEIQKGLGLGNKRYIGLIGIKQSWLSLEKEDDNINLSIKESIVSDEDVLENANKIIILESIYSTLLYLDDDEYRVVILKFFYNKTIKEIKTILGYSRQRVEQFLHSALSKLKKYNEFLGD